MKKRHSARFAALLLSVLFLFSSCSLPVDLPFWPFNNEKAVDIGTRRTIPFSEMEYERPDADAIIAEVEAMQAQLETVDDFDTLLSLDEKVGTTTEYFYTMSTIAMIHTYLDSYDEFFEAESRYCEERGSELDNAVTKFNKTILEGPFREDYKEYVGEHVFQAIENSFLLNSDAVVELRQQRSALNADYNKLLSTMSIEYEGKAYTMNDIVEIEDYPLRRQLLISLWEENNPEFAGMYLDQIELDKKIASTLGFDTPADMFYMSYNRDYTPQDTLAYFETVREAFVPLQPLLASNQVGYIEADYDKTLAAMPKALSQIDPQLEEAWRFMTKYELNNYAPAPEKQMGIAFTTELYAFDAPYCYSYWSDDFNSVSTIIHEFGHFYDSWLRYDAGVPQNLDIAEVYSQGLEVVMQPHYKNFTTSSQAAQVGNLLDLCDSVITQSFYEEFQMKMYEAENLDAEGIADLFSSLSEEYGLADYYGGDFKYFWLNVTHFFDAPFYTISYVTSAVVALQLWTPDENRWEHSAETYIKLIQADQNKPFLQLLKDNGLANPLEPATLSSISSSLEEYLAPASRSFPKAA